MGSYVKHKINMLNDLYGNAAKVTTAQRYFELLQGGGPNGYYYGGRTMEERRAYGPKIMNEMIPSIKKYLT